MALSKGPALGAPYFRAHSKVDPYLRGRALQLRFSELPFILPHRVRFIMCMKAGGKICAACIV